MAFKFVFHVNRWEVLPMPNAQSIRVVTIRCDIHHVVVVVDALCDIESRIPKCQIEECNGTLARDSAVCWVFVHVRATGCYAHCRFAVQWGSGVRAFL